MQKIELTHFICHYKYQDFGKPKTLVLSNSLGSNLAMWDANIAVWRTHFNILRYDSRGHGESSIAQDRLTIADLGGDVIELLNALKLDRVYFCGLSIGGLVGQWLGIHHPSRFEKIILSNTAAKIGTAEGWNNRIEQVSQDGLASILTATSERWFSADYRAKHHQEVAVVLEAFAATSLRGYIACCHALAAADFSAQLQAISVAVLVIVGLQDEVTTVADGERIRQGVPLAKLATLDAAHLSNIEHPEAFANHLLYFAQH
ncbi:3-oxoadipate enol-lactonase [Flavobacterium sp. JP2137]|uniref:3-oxoadipate enol-lactonase n=1 Tax=Flavobacterium sp. JP2137 TaxID=3414510 RepID=UPI003D2FD1AD